MSFPFGGHPTLHAFLVWAERQGHTVRSGVRTDNQGRPNSVVLIEVPETTRHVLIVGMRESEVLTPTFVAYLERRLGVQSDFPSLDGY
jgi:hypothetical protein